MTRLGHFSPMYVLGDWAIFWRVKKLPNIWGYFFMWKLCMYSFWRAGLGYHMGNFFANSSGQPACEHPVKACQIVKIFDQLTSACTQTPNFLNRGVLPRRRIFLKLVFMPKKSLL
jgi:hypothetical protein